MNNRIFLTISWIAICLFAGKGHAANITVTKPGAAVSFWRPGYKEYDIGNNAHIVLDPVQA